MPRDVASRNAKTVVDEGRGVGPLRNGVYLDFADAIDRFGAETIKARYGNLFDMYERITGEDPYTVPMRIYPATHYTMGGLWVDYDLQTTIPGLFALGEANFSDHGANRLGASALMQGLADGYFVAPETVAGYLAGLLGTSPLETPHEAFTTVARRDARTAPTSCSRSRAPTRSTTTTVSWASWSGTTAAWPATGPAWRRPCRRSLRCATSSGPTSRSSATATSFNQSLEKALRVADFMEFAELKVRDALHREESCGGHFREEHQTEEGEAKRDDENFAYVARLGVRRPRHPERRGAATRSRSCSRTSS